MPVYTMYIKTGMEKENCNIDLTKRYRLKDQMKNLLPNHKVTYLCDIKQVNERSTTGHLGL